MRFKINLFFVLIKNLILVVNFMKIIGFSINKVTAEKNSESKGKIENVVKFVKNNFMSCREALDMEDINNAILERIVSRAFHKLKPDQQSVLNLFSEGHSYEDDVQELDLDEIKNDINQAISEKLSKYFK